MSILVSIGAVGVAASMPNWSLCHIIWAASSLGNDVWQRRGELGGIRPGDKFSYMMEFCASIDCGGRRCPMATMRPYSQHRSTQQSANMLGNKLVSLKLGKIIANYVFFTLRHNALTNC
jgi:hypothetical protein